MLFSSQMQNISPYKILLWRKLPLAQLNQYKNTYFSGSCFIAKKQIFGSKRQKISEQKRNNWIQNINARDLYSAFPFNYCYHTHLPKTSSSPSLCWWYRPWKDYLYLSPTKFPAQECKDIAVTKSRVVDMATANRQKILCSLSRWKSLIFLTRGRRKKYL